MNINGDAPSPAPPPPSSPGEGGSIFVLVHNVRLMRVWVARGTRRSFDTNVEQIMLTLPLVLTWYKAMRVLTLHKCSCHAYKQTTHRIICCPTSDVSRHVCILCHHTVLRCAFRTFQKVDINRSIHNHYRSLQDLPHVAVNCFVAQLLMFDAALSPPSLLQLHPLCQAPKTVQIVQVFRWTGTLYPHRLLSRLCSKRSPISPGVTMSPNRRIGYMLRVKNTMTFYSPSMTPVYL